MTLHQAAEKGDIEALERLLREGDDPDATDERGFTPLYCAAARGRTEAAALLLEHGATVGFPTPGGWTPLHHAAYAGHRDLVALLLDHGARAGAQDVVGLAPLHYAAERGHGGVVSLLLRHGARFPPEGDLIPSPLHLAAQHGHREVIAVLRPLALEGQAHLLWRLAKGAIAGGPAGLLATAPLALLSSHGSRWILPLIFGVPIGACAGVTVAGWRAFGEQTSLGCLGAIGLLSTYLLGCYLVLGVQQYLPWDRWQNTSLEGMTTVALFAAVMAGGTLLAAVVPLCASGMARAAARRSS